LIFGNFSIGIHASLVLRKQKFNWYLNNENLLNWYLSRSFLKISIHFKTLLKAKRTISFRGALFSQRKSIWNRGRNFKSWKCLLQSYSYTFDYLQKDFEMIFKKICKNKNKWCKCGSKILNKIKATHSYLMSLSVGLNPSNLCTYHMQTSWFLHFIYLLWFMLASITKKGEIEREIGLTFSYN
jgi:hypothetical protein